MSKKTVIAFASLLSFASVAVAQASDPQPPSAPAPQENKDAKKTDKVPEKKEDAKGGAPAGGEKK